VRAFGPPWLHITFHIHRCRTSNQWSKLLSDAYSTQNHYQNEMRLVFDELFGEIRTAPSPDPSVDKLIWTGDSSVKLHWNMSASSFRLQTKRWRSSLVENSRKVLPYQRTSIKEHSLYSWEFPGLQKWNFSTHVHYGHFSDAQNLIVLISQKECRAIDVFTKSRVDLLQKLTRGPVLLWRLSIFYSSFHIFASPVFEAMKPRSDTVQYLLFRSLIVHRSALCGW
jgi:hypothetical protein